MFEFKTKAQTIHQLYDQLSYGKILPSYLFTVNDFLQNEKKIILELSNRFNSKSVIVRSSAVNEDSKTHSNAGCYESILNVNANSINELTNAIQSVIASYTDDNGNNEILVQPMLDNILRSGVVLTRDLDTHAPYYIVNYDESEATDSVTSGYDNSSKTYIYYKYSQHDISEQWLKSLFKQIDEIENFFTMDALDIEFAFTRNEILYIFQVRPITTVNSELSKVNLTPLLRKVKKKITKLQTRHPNLLGNRSIFGVMPDWNPAEIIGLKPRKLAITLYKELITDSVWSSQRENYGYRSLKSHPLLVSFIGVPYIDMRVDFNSFIPNKLDESIAEKLVNYYLNEMETHPAFHDKIEFEIVYSCYYLNINEDLKKLRNYGFEQFEIKKIEDSLRDITNRIIKPDSGFFYDDLKKIKMLDSKYYSIVNSNLSLIDKIYWLIQDCKTYGTLPFAGIARAAFISAQFISSMIRMNILSIEDSEAFMRSLNTVSKQLGNSFTQLKSGKISKQQFLQSYGHLRPGTYDILSLRYDEDFDTYFNNSYQVTTNEQDNRDIEFTEQQINLIDSFLKKNKIEIRAKQLIIFIKETMEAREQAKLLFTRSLSKSLQLVEELGKRNSLSKDDVSFLDIREIIKLYSELDHRDMKNILLDNIQINKDYSLFTNAVKLPSLILKPGDVYGFYLEDEMPNYITLKQVEANVFAEKKGKQQDYKGKIAFIKSADPGYDYLFAKGIAGLVTQFGGSNSHMAIRCAELGLPAVIGAGEKLFNQWLGYKVIRIDCLSKQVIGIV